MACSGHAEEKLRPSEIRIMDDLLYSVFGIVVLVLAFFLMKKVASCLIKTIVTVIIAVILGVIYYAYFAA